MKKIGIIIIIGLFLMGCQNSNRDIFERTEKWFNDNYYLISFGPQAILITSDNNSLMASVENADGDITEITYMNSYVAEGIKVNMNGEYELLPDTDNGEKYYDEYMELLEEIDISEEKLFAFCEWKYREFYDYAQEQQPNSKSE